MADPLTKIKSNFLDCLENRTNNSSQSIPRHEARRITLVASHRKMSGGSSVAQIQLLPGAGLGPHQRIHQSPMSS